MDKSQMLRRLQMMRATMQNFIEDINSMEKYLLNEDDSSLKRKKEISLQRVRESNEIEVRIRASMRARLLQGQFKLKLPPHYSRVLQYEATKDPSVFDGLKREWE